ncbi:MAG: hypothetical protein LBD24_02850, partial [Spirochaetaceae bacterium]|nr:hypothetical protein [Spirochaetaceae bacterium]
HRVATPCPGRRLSAPTRGASVLGCSAASGPSPTVSNMAVCYFKAVQHRVRRADWLLLKARLRFAQRRSLRLFQKRPAKRDEAGGDSLAASGGWGNRFPQTPR